MGFLPELKDEKKESSTNIPMALYATADGWLMEEDVNLQTRLERLDLNDDYRKQISDLLANNIPGSYIRLPQSVLVVLEPKCD